MAMPTSTVTPPAGEQLQSEPDFDTFVYSAERNLLRVSTVYLRPSDGDVVAFPLTAFRYTGIIPLEVSLTHEVTADVEESYSTLSLLSQYKHQAGPRPRLNEESFDEVLRLYCAAAKWNVVEALVAARCSLSQPHRLLVEQHLKLMLDVASRHDDKALQRTAAEALMQRSDRLVFLEDPQVDAAFKTHFRHWLKELELKARDAQAYCEAACFDPHCTEYQERISECMERLAGDPTRVRRLREVFVVNASIKICCQRRLEEWKGRLDRDAKHIGISFYD
ncbi:hypothetical protein MKEN_00176600 [Mycena kentingensis (nom. inval.)]|nr:hypothetical protein MKEN_00176600 [Mycena kentingensis (nom. inval.)]